MATDIISWNLNSISAKYPFLQLLKHDFAPFVLCLQETNLEPSQNFTLKNYNFYRRDDIPDAHAKGGVAIAIQSKYRSDEIQLQTIIQAVAARTYFEKLLTICTIYLHHSLPLDQQELQKLFSQLATPFLVTGDFNVHSTL